MLLSLACFLEVIKGLPFLPLKGIENGRVTKRSDCCSGFRSGEIGPRRITMLLTLRLLALCLLCQSTGIVQSQSITSQRKQRAATILEPQEEPSQRVLSELPALERLKVATSSIPVLLITNPRAFDSVRLVVEEMYYSAFFKDTKHSISIQASRWINSYSNLTSRSSRTGKALRSAQAFSTQSEGIWSAGLKAHNAILATIHTLGETTFVRHGIASRLPCVRAVGVIKAKISARHHAIRIDTSLFQQPTEG